MNARRLLSTLAAVALLAAACAPAPSAPVASSPAATATLAKLAAAYSNITADVLPIWVAVDAGITKANALDVDSQYIEGGSRTMAALLAGQFQVALVGGSEAVSAVSQGEDLVMVAMLTPVYPYLFMARPQIKTAADLKGKKVGVGSIGGSADIATRIALRNLGLDPTKDVTILAMGSHQQRTAALLAGSIDAAVDDPPNTVELENNGLHALYDLAGKKIPAAQTAVVARRSWVEANRAVMQRFVDSLVLAVAKIRKDREGTIATLKKYFKSEDTKAMGIAYDFYVNEVAASYPYPTAEQFTETLAELSKTNAKLVGFDVTKILERSFVKSAEDRKLGQ